jgi:NAD(P)-dependent dehydrogenase (short-subunit alcohol dehydrogenase family)
MTATQVPEKWDASMIPSLKNKVAIVTGANSGIGYVTARELARKGADVVLACRGEERGRAAEANIKKELANVPEAGNVAFAKLDVSSLESVQTFAEDFKRTHTQLDLLVNNAGIMGVPYTLTVDGVESQFATNHLGHFALTARLFDVLKTTASSRIVNVSSILHSDSKLDEDNIVTTADKYNEDAVYADTKLVNILFTKELDRRLKAAGVDCVAAVCHPGVTATNMLAGPISVHGFFAGLKYRFANVFIVPLLQSADMGALPTLFAATAPGVQGGDYFGPDGFQRIRGYPVLEQPSPVAESPSAGAKVWTLSERLAKLSFEVSK